MADGSNSLEERGDDMADNNTLRDRVSGVEGCVRQLSIDLGEMKGRQEERHAATERRLGGLEEGMNRGFRTIFDKIDAMRDDFSTYKVQRAELNGERKLEMVTKDGEQDTTLTALEERVSLRSTLIVAIAAATPGLASAIILLIQIFGGK
jgi:hypothetical protein